MRVLEVFVVFLRLGLTSFGGPIAHLAYFRDEFVARRGWISDAEYADLVALCQFLPGPASSQVGFAIGRRRAGLAGALAAFLGFTLPSFALMTAAALGVTRLDAMTLAPWIMGLKLAAVAVVLHAVLSMAQSLCPDWRRRGFAALVAAALLIAAHPLAQIGVIAIGLGLGPWLAPAPAASAAPPPPASRGGALLWGAAFVALLVALPIAAAVAPNGSWALVDAMARAGALVFGGGHVVLPLLETAMTAPGWMTSSQVLTGYALAQAIPGPLFTLSAYLGALAGAGPGGVAGAALATVAIFTPGFLILLAAEPVWARLKTAPRAQQAVAGANAAVVGVLAAALIDPIAVGAMTRLVDAAVVIALFALLRFAKAPAWLVVGLGALAGYALASAAQFL